jgi:CheY-like chemotaxis protein
MNLTGGMDVVLVVDDNVTQRLWLARSLRKTGLQVDFACDGLDALARIAGNANYKFVVMDVDMPNMDGLTATEIIRAAEVDSGCDPLYIIGVSAGHYDVECKRAGMNKFLQKPVLLGQIEALLKELDQIGVVQYA